MNDALSENSSESNHSPHTGLNGYIAPKGNYVLGFYKKIKNCDRTRNVIALDWVPSLKY